MKLNISVLDMQKAQEQIVKELEKRFGDAFVTVGIHEESGGSAQHTGGDGITNAQLGATLHYGAEIKHPGGTTYGYKTEADKNNKKVSFMKQGEGFEELGVTQPHDINIPPRPWLDVGASSGNERYLKIIADTVDKDEPIESALEKIGIEAVGFVQKYMTELKTPPNAPSTIAAKGSDNPLIDTGLLRQSITYKISSDEPDEGLD